MFCFKQDFNFGFNWTRGKKKLDSTTKNSVHENSVKGFWLGFYSLSVHLYFHTFNKCEKSFLPNL